MLLRFSVENFSCFREEAVFSLIASIDDRHPNHIINVDKLRVLRAASIYGANGHGKTRFIEAIDFMQTLIMLGTKSIDEKINVIPYKLNKKTLSGSSKFVIEFRSNEINYEYGIVVNRDYIEEEWLFSYPKTREVRLFERITKDTSKGLQVEIEFGPSLKKGRSPSSKYTLEAFLDFVASGTRPNQLFLTEAMLRNVNRLNDVFEWFSRTLQIISAESQYQSLHSRARDENSFLSFLSKFVSEADIGIEELELQEAKLDLANLKSIPDEIRTDIISKTKKGAVLGLGSEGVTKIIRQDEDGDLIIQSLHALRRNDEGKLVRFDLEEESAGTRRFLDLLPMLASLADRECVYIVDELDRKLHPTLAYRLIEIFLEGAQTGQLVFTTHNTHLLDLDLLRRDEIWFVQKNSNASEMYSLADMRIRPDLDIEKGYLSGRFGGLPRALFSEIDYNKLTKSTS